MVYDACVTWLFMTDEGFEVDTDRVVCVMLGWTLLECGMSDVQFGLSADISPFWITTCCMVKSCLRFTGK